MAWNVAQALVLFGSMLLATWVGITAFQKVSLPGRQWLGWLQFAIAFWCADPPKAPAMLNMRVVSAAVPCL